MTFVRTVLTVPTVLAAVVCITVGSPSASGRAFQPDHDHKSKEHAAPKPKNYADGVAIIDKQLAEISALIQKGKLDDVHTAAAVIRDVAPTLGALSLRIDSHVPREAIKEVNLTSKALADKFDAIDKAGDSGDLAGTKKVYEEMVVLQAVLKQYGAAGPAQYVCPMHCEPGKVYDKPGKCPVCHMALVKITDEKYEVSVIPSSGIQPGKPTALKFTITDPAGAVVKKLDTVHEKILHLLMVSKDLSWYSHEHPVVQPDGTFTLTFTFPHGGDYVLFHDFTPPDVGQQVVQAPIAVLGDAPPLVPLVADAEKPKTIDGYTISLNTGGPLRVGSESKLKYEITRDGKPVTDLEPYLGAMGHLVIFSQDLKHFVHSHPLEHESQVASTGPAVEFHALFEAPGLYKGFAQFQHKGRIITVPFTFSVQPADPNAPPVAPHEHSH